MKYTSVIESFSGEYRWLSNFWMTGDFSVEHHYQAAKTTNHNDWCLIMSAETPGQAKRLARTIQIREDWNDVRLTLMEQFTREKYACDFDLRTKLLDTRGSLLVEGNTWGDTFWGVCNGVGENHLGKILMRVRDRFL